MVQDKHSLEPCMKLYYMANGFTMKIIIVWFLVRSELWTSYQCTAHKFSKLLFQNIQQEISLNQEKPHLYLLSMH